MADGTSSTTQDPTLDLVVEARYHSLIADRHLQLAVGEGLWHIRGLGWQTDATRLPDGDETVASIDYRFNRSLERIVRLDGVLAFVLLRSGEFVARLAAARPTALDAAEARLRAAVPQAAPSRDHEVGVTFWHWDEHGPESTHRRLAVSAWAETRGHYARGTREGLARLLALEPTPESGRLLLWHGPPGTGKTSALRALGWEWRRWCDVDYIVDPETFFGARPGYMLRLLTQSAAGDRWRLLVLEDTGELMRVDAKDQMGQGLSRLLNLVDGLIGQGLRVLVLVTTNEPLESLADAVSRPGRCAANVTFEPLSAGEARAWLAERDCDRPVSGEMTLADLYAVVAGGAAPSRRRVGFAPVL